MKNTKNQRDKKNEKNLGFSFTKKQLLK
jgi:hypothetical protein